MLRVTVWNEFRSEKNNSQSKAIYPNGMHEAIASFLKSDDISVRCATLEEPENGLPQALLDETDVIIWWGHMAHKQVDDEVARRVADSVLKGMGAIFLHSAHHSKPFKLLMGTSCNLSWREDGDLERLWVCDPSHPIAKGVGRYVEIPHEEMYGEPFGIPEPEKTVFLGWYEGGELFRSGCCYKRGNGNVFYFQPGHETYPIYHQKEIQDIIRNAVYWAAPTYREAILEAPQVKMIGKK